MYIDQRKARLLFISLTFFVFSLLILIGLFGKIEFNPILNTRLEWGILILGVILSSVIVLWVRYVGKFDLFEFPIWISLNVYLQVLVSYWLFNTDPGKIYPSLRNDFNNWMFQALLLISASLLALWLGYIFYNRRMKDPIKKISGSARQFNLSRTIIVWFFLWLIITLAVPLNLIGWGGTAIGVWGNYLEFINILYLAAFSALAIYHFRKPTTLGWIWLSLTVIISLINGVAIGTRATIFVLINLVILIYYATGRFKWQLLFAGGLIVLILVPAATHFRSIVPRFSPVEPEKRFSTTFEAVAGTIDRPIGDLYEQVADLFGARQGSLFMVTASVIRNHPMILPFIMEPMVEQIAIGLIPRIIWPSKPVGNPELYYITITYSDRSSESSFTAIGLIADSYRIGGWFVSILFFIFLGIIMAWVYWRGPLNQNMVWIIFYISLLGIITYDGNIYSLSTFVIQRSIILWGFINFILFSKKSDKQLITNTNS